MRKLRLMKLRARLHEALDKADGNLRDERVRRIAYEFDRELSAMIKFENAENENEASCK